MCDEIKTASAEPSAPKCKYCGDTGQIMVGRSGDANDGNAPIMEPCEDCDGTGSSGGQMHSNGVDEPEYERFKCETCDGLGAVGNILNAEPCPDCSYSAPVERDEPVAWFTEDQLTDKSATTWDSTVAERWRAKGWPVGELFTRAALERKPPTTPRDAFAAWEPTGNPIRGVNGRLAAKAGFDAGWCAGWTECRADMERKPS